MGAVGSTAVRAAIERHQPLASLHGHVHESAGFRRIGKTLAVNPGSDYGTGALNGALLVLDGDKVKAHQLVRGMSDRAPLLRRRRRRHDRRAGGGHRPARRSRRRGPPPLPRRARRIPAGPSRTPATGRSTRWRRSAALPVACSAARRASRGDRADRPVPDGGADRGRRPTPLGAGDALPRQPCRGRGGRDARRAAAPRRCTPAPATSPQAFHVGPEGALAAAATSPDVYAATRHVPAAARCRAAAADRPRRDRRDARRRDDVLRPARAPAGRATCSPASTSTRPSSPRRCRRGRRRPPCPPPRPPRPGFPPGSRS